MADLVTSQTNFSGNKRAIFTFTSVSDATGESAVTKIDISTLPGEPSIVRITQAWFCVSGGAVKILFDHTTDETVAVLGGVGHLDWHAFGGLKDPAGAGDTGDIKFTTVGMVANDIYTITLEVEY